MGLWFIGLFLILGPCVMSSLYDITEGRVGDLVTLPCSVTCPDGNVKWSKVDELELAVDCAQGICVERLDFENRTALSTENISLIINPLRLQDVGMFISSCNGKEVCDVKLKVVPHQNSLEKMTGTSVYFPLFGEDPVQVTLTTNSSNVSLCILDSGTPHLNQYFGKRLEFTNGSLVLHSLSRNDSGVITVMSYRNKIIISTCKLTVFRAVMHFSIWMIQKEFLLACSHLLLLAIGFALGYLFKQNRRRIVEQQSPQAQEIEMVETTPLKIPIE